MPTVRRCPVVSQAMSSSSFCRKHGRGLEYQPLKCFRQHEIFASETDLLHDREDGLRTFSRALGIGFCGIVWRTEGDH
jgi:hypothetical protein